MKKTATVIIGLIFMLATTGTALAHRNEGFERLILGVASGAIIGQVIARDVEGALVGSVIGGTLGLMADQGHNRLVVVDGHRPRHVTRVYVGNDNRHRHNGWRYDKLRRRGRSRHYDLQRRGRW